MAYKLKLKAKPPRVFVGVPTGPVKEYALLYMLASLKDLDYNPQRMKICFAATDTGDRKFIMRMWRLIENSNFMCPTEMLVTKPTDAESERWQAYSYVVKNMQTLRQKFLSEPYDYFMILGGDNPPLRDMVKRLMALDVDIASALVFQRPMKDYLADGVAWPMVFTHKWTLNHLEHNGLNREQKRLLRKAWVEVGFHRPVWSYPNWRRLKLVRGAAFGDGCCLVRRRVFEKIPYRMSPSMYLSQDLQFCQDALAAGFTTAVDMTLHCPHLCMDGQAY